MADTNVFITGAASGAFTEALNDLPPWATENTAAEIEKILKKSLDIQSKALTALVKNAQGSNNLNNETLKKTNDELDRYLKQLKEENKAVDQQRKNRKEDDDYFNKDKKNKRDSLASSTKLTKAFIGLEAIIGVVGTVFYEGINTYDKLFKSGVSLIDTQSKITDGFDSLGHLTALTGIRFTELAGIMQKFSGAINSFGSQKFAKTVGLATKDLISLGFSSKETAELLGAYLETQRGFTDVRNKSEIEVAGNLKKFGERVTKLSLATGMAREQILQNIEALSKSNEANILSANVGEKAAESTLQFIASMQDQNFARQWLGMLTDTFKPLNETFMNLQKVGAGDLGQRILNFQESIKNLPAEEQAQAVKQFVDQNKTELELKKRQIAILRQTMPAEANASLSFINGLEQQARAIKIQSKSEIERAVKTEASIKEFQTNLEKFLSTLQTLFLPFVNNLLKVSTVVLESINDISKFSTSISPTMTAFIVAVGIAGAAIAGLSLSIKGISSLFKLLLGGISFGGKGKGADLPGGKGKGVGAGIGGFFGDLLGGTLGGIADGLKKLGDPKVLLGVVTLAGLAGTLWITGNAIKSFVGLDWDAMGKAGVAIVALGAAGAAAGALAELIAPGAIALGLLGGAMWVIGKAFQEVGPGITALLVGLDGLSKLDSKGLISVSGSLALLGPAMALFGASMVLATPGISLGSMSLNLLAPALSNLSSSINSFSGLSKLKDIISTINSIDVLKAAAFGVISKFSTPTTTSVVTPTSPTLSTLNSPSKISLGQDQTVNTAPKANEPTKAVGSGVEKPPVSSTEISTLISYQNSLMEQVLLSVNRLNSTETELLRVIRARY